MYLTLARLRTSPEIVLVKEVAVHLAGNVEFHMQCVDENYPVGTTHHLPVARMAKERVLKYFVCTKL